MKLGELIKTLKFEHFVEIRDENNIALMECKSDSKALKHYEDCEIVMWFSTSRFQAGPGLVALIREEEEDG